MGQTIYKYELELSDSQTIYMPKGAEILTVQVQDGRPVIWVLVAPSKGRAKEERMIETFGTGNPIESENIERRYIGTYQMMGGSLIFHVFERECLKKV